MAQEVGVRHPVGRHIAEQQRVFLDQCLKLLNATLHDISQRRRESRCIAERTRSLDHDATHLVMVELIACSVGTIVRDDFTLTDIWVDSVVDIILVELSHNERLTIALNQTLDICLVRREHLLGTTHLELLEHPVIDIHLRESYTICTNQTSRNITTKLRASECHSVDGSYDLVYINRRAHIDYVDTRYDECRCNND